MKKKALILSGISWNSTIQRHHTLAKFLNDMNYDVVFIESIPSSIFTWKKLYLKIYSRFTNKKEPNQSDGITIVNCKFINPYEGLFKLYNQIKIRNFIKKYGSEFEVIVNYLPINITEMFVQNICHKVLIYDCVRDFSNWGGYTKKLEFYEDSLIKTADVILTDSYYLTNKIRMGYINKKNVQILPTVNSELKRVLDKCSVKQNIKNIVYFGHVGSHIDIDLMRDIFNDGYNIHIIGELSVNLDFEYISHGFYNDLLEMGECIASYADAIIIPYKGNMDGVIPAKLMQSLATKLPVFVNKFYDSDFMSEYLYVYENTTCLRAMLTSFSIDQHNKRLKNISLFVHQNIESKQYEKFKGCINDAVSNKTH